MGRVDEDVAGVRLRGGAADAVFADAKALRSSSEARQMSESELERELLFLLLSVMLVAASAEADLCSPAWLRTASGSEARALIRAGADVNERCSANGNRNHSCPRILRAMVLSDRMLVTVSGAPPAEQQQRPTPLAGDAAGGRRHSRGHDAFDDLYLPQSAVFRGTRRDAAELVGVPEPGDGCDREAHRCAHQQPIHFT